MAKSIVNPSANVGGTVARGNRQSSLDVLKCVAALFVVFIHFGTPWLSPLTRTAVPLFFLITGYYYPVLMERGTFWKHVHKVFVMAVCASALYAAYALQHHLRNGTLSEWLATTFTPREILRTLVFNFSFFGLHLWYFWAVLYDLLLFRLLDRIGWSRHLRWIIPLLFIVFCVGSYFPWFWKLRNWLFFGLPCMTVGRWIREGNDKSFRFLNDKIRWKRWAAFAFLLICVEYIAQYLLLGVNGRESYAFTLPLVVIFFYHALRYPRLGEGSLWATIGRRYSAYIYIIHMMVGMIIGHLFAFDNPLGKCFFSAVVFVLSLLLSILWGKGEQWLRSAKHPSA